MSGQKRAVSFGWSLLLSMSASVVLLGGALIVASMIATEHTLAQLSGTLITAVTKTTDARLEGFFEPVESELAVGAERWKSGEFRRTWDLAELDRYFKPVVESLPQVSGVVFATAGGEFYLLMREGGTWMSRHLHPVDMPGEELWREWPTGEQPVPGVRRVTKYVPARRDWFVGARKTAAANSDLEQRKRIFWTDPYFFFTSKQPGVTASLEFELADGTTAILGFDVLLADISEYTTSLSVGELGSAFVIRGSADDPENVDVIGLPADERFDDAQSIADKVLKKPEDVGGALGAFAVGAFADAAAEEGAPQRFMSDGQAWWGAVRRSRLSSSDPLWVGAVVPEEQLLDGFPDTKRTILVVTLLAVLAAVFASRTVARGYSRPIDGLVRAGERMQRLNFQPSEPVRTRITEIRQLASTLDEMRTALLSHTAVREDIRIAHSVRQQLTLPTDVPELPELEIEAWHTDGEEIGGESIDVQRRGRRVLFVAFDVAGSGVLPVVYGIALRAAFRAAVRTGADLQGIAQELHAVVRNDLPSPCRLPTWLGCLDADAGELTWISLGHAPALIVRADGERSEVLDAGGPIVGDGEVLTTPEPKRRELDVGDVLAVVSDGVHEAMDDERLRLGSDGVIAVVREAGAAPLPEMMALLRETLARGRASPDDRSALFVRRAAPAADDASPAPPIS